MVWFTLVWLLFCLNGSIFVYLKMFLHLQPEYFFIRKIPGSGFKCSLHRSSEKLGSLKDSIRIVVLFKDDDGTSEMFYCAYLPLFIIQNLFFQSDFKKFFCLCILKTSIFVLVALLMGVNELVFFFFSLQMLLHPPSIDHCVTSQIFLIFWEIFMKFFLDSSFSAYRRCRLLFQLPLLI